MKTIKIFYFSDCTTIEEVKKKYRDLAMKMHPDKGGDEEEMKAVNEEYAFICAKLASGETMTAEETETTILNAEAYRMAIEKVIGLDGIIIEIVGAWIWITGDTRTHSEYLKNPEGGKYFWAKKKLAWYFRSDEYKSANRSKMSLDDIRRKYGSQVIPGKAKPTLYDKNKSHAA